VFGYRECHEAHFDPSPLGALDCPQPDAGFFASWQVVVVGVLVARGTTERREKIIRLRRYARVANAAVTEHNGLGIHASRQRESALLAFGRIPEFLRDNAHHAASDLDVVFSFRVL
jgi:hypothetical protein